MAESVHDWFEASDPNLFSTHEDESDPSWPGSSRALAAQATSDKWAVDQPWSISVSEPRDKAQGRCIEGFGVNAAPTIQSEVEEGTTTRAVAADQPTYVIEEGVDCGTDNKAETGTSDGSELGNPGGVVDLPYAPST